MQDMWHAVAATSRLLFYRAIQSLEIRSFLKTCLTNVTGVVRLIYGYIRRNGVRLS